MNDLRERIKEARELCDLPGSYGTLAVVRRKLDEMLSVPEAKPREVTDEDALQILRGYWRNVGASFGEMEIKHVVELLEAFVARRKPDPTPELRERIISAVMDASSKDIEWEYSEDAEQFAQRIADAVLSTLGEPK